MDTADTSQPPADGHLLALAHERFLDGRGRLIGTCGIRILVSRDGQRLFVGSDVPDWLARALVDTVNASPPAPTPEIKPPALERCRAILASACAPLSLDAGPYYVFQGDVRIETQAEIARADASTGERLQRLNPGNWGAEEWDELLGGALGPWAMAVIDGRVVSICHTPVPMTERAAECGVWTHPEYRGRGYAAAVTATWAAIVRPSGRYLFYSTTAGNRSSQRVAARLHLRPLGWYWSLSRANPERDDHRHPLSGRSFSVRATD